MTECTSPEFFAKAPGRREFAVRFDGGDISSDGGALLLGQVEQRRRILSRLAECFTDARDPSRVEHTMGELVSQRVIGLALGYEDVCDHAQLRLDPLLSSLVGKRDPKGAARKRERDSGVSLAAPATLSRLENGHPGLVDDDRYRRIALDFAAADRLLLDIFIEAYAVAPEKIVLDFDATDDRVHGKQVGRAFHGYYDHYCFLPLYVFAGDHLLAARLRPSDIDGAAGSLEELVRIVAGIREAWPKTRIVVRGDSGFCREWLMSWCEANGVDFVLGLAKNDRLLALVEEPLDEVRRRHEREGVAVRDFVELRYRTIDSWSRERRVVAKAEHLSKGSNPRFVVTSLGAESVAARELYEDLYCARGEMENRIKEQQLDLFADRTSCHLFRANQVRLYFSSFAYVLLSELRRLALAGTELARAQCGTIRLKLLKIGAQVRVTVRRVWVSLSESCPYRAIFVEAWRRLVPS